MLRIPHGDYNADAVTLYVPARLLSNPCATSTFVFLTGACVGCSRCDDFAPICEVCCCVSTIIPTECPASKYASDVRYLFFCRYLNPIALSIVLGQFQYDMPLLQPFSVRQSPVCNLPPFTIASGRRTEQVCHMQL